MYALAVSQVGIDTILRALDVQTLGLSLHGEARFVTDERSKHLDQTSNILLLPYVELVVLRSQTLVCH